MMMDQLAEEMLNFSTAYGDDDIPSMPCFEASNADDRPVAPSAEDYPLGCEVELRDVEFAKVAQEASHWEPFMDEVFAMPRRRVKVCRHLGDYTFVMCKDVPGYDLVCCTLYRACLSEPKVKMTKYYSDLNQIDDHGGMDLLTSNIAGGKLGTGDTLMPDDDDMFSRPIYGVPILEEIAVSRTAIAVAAGPTISPATSSKPIPITDDAISGSVGPSPSPGMCSTSPDGHMSEGDEERAFTTGSTTANNNINNVRRRSKFAVAMRRGTLEISNHNYERALSYYNTALAEAPEEEARTLSSRSVAYLLLRQTENALKDAKRVIELQPESYLGFVRAGNVLRGMKQFNDAQCYYNEAHRRDPTNQAVRKLMMGNSIAMLYDARTKRFPRFKIVYDEGGNRVIAVARQALRKGDCVLKEATSMFSTLRHPGGSVAACGQAAVCTHCGRPLLNEGDICNAIPGLRPEWFRSLYSAPDPVRCNHECGDLYCSNECRSKAWAEHHWVECARRGRWRDGVRTVHEFVDHYVAERAAAGIGDSDSGAEGPMSAAEDMSPMIVAACARVAVRMLTRMLGCVWSLVDAVHMYDWLHVTPIVQAQRSGVAPFLREIFRLLSSGFLGEERRTLTYELFERCYQRAKSNALLLRVSAWGNIQIRAEGHMELVDGEEDGVTLSVAPPSDTGRASSTGRSRAVPHPPCTPSSASTTQTSCLRFILNAPATGIPETFKTCLCLLELFASTRQSDEAAPIARPPSTRQPAAAAPTRRGEAATEVGAAGCMAATPAPNVCLHQIVFPYACVRVYAGTNVEKGDVLRCAPPHYTPV